MVFGIIGSIVAVIATILFAFYYVKKDSCDALVGAFVSGVISICAIGLLFGCLADAKQNKAFIQSIHDNPTNYTYSQIAEYNEFATKSRVWQGTIFSFYNDTDLHTINIDSVSQKVIVESNK